MSVRQIPANIIRPPCNEQTGYTPTILNGMINDIILLQVLRYVKSVSKAEIFEAGYQAQMSEKAIVNKAQRTNRYPFPLWLAGLRIYLPQMSPLGIYDLSSAEEAATTQDL